MYVFLDLLCWKIQLSTTSTSTINNWICAQTLGPQCYQYKKVSISTQILLKKKIQNNKQYLYGYKYPCDYINTPCDLYKYSVMCINTPFDLYKYSL